MANQKLPTPTPEARRMATESYQRALQVFATGNHDYAIWLLTNCCKADPGNLLYHQTLRRVQKSKYNHRRGSRLAFLLTARSRAKLRAAKRDRQPVQVLILGEQILNRNPWDLAVQMDMASAADELGLSDLAVWLLDQARERHGDNPTLNRMLARLFERRGDFHRAGFLWELVRKAVPDDVEASHKAKDLAASETIAKGQYERHLTDPDDDRSTEADPDEAALASPEDRLAQQAATLRERLADSPTDPQLYLQLARLYRRHGKLAIARETLQDGLAACGQDFSLRLESLELDLLPLQQNLAKAQEQARHAPPEQAEQARQLAEQCQRELWARELELYRLKADRFPAEMSHRLEMGLRLRALGQLDEAISQFQQARRDPRLLWRALLQLGHCFTQRNNWRLAQRNFQECLQALPSEEENARKEVLYQLAQGHANAGDLAQAIDIGHELANLDFAYRDIGRLLDEWQSRLQQV
jgi:Flp pilus assembly protein TadD